MKKEDFSSSDLEQTLQVALHGVPELKRFEKRKFLGSFRERVIKVLLIAQLEQFHHSVHPDIVLAMKHPQADWLLIRSDYINQASCYLKLAQECGLRFKTVFRDDLIGEVALLIAAKEAVKVEDIFIS